MHRWIFLLRYLHRYHSSYPLRLYARLDIVHFRCIIDCSSSSKMMSGESGYGGMKSGARPRRMSRGQRMVLRKVPMIGMTGVGAFAEAASVDLTKSLLAIRLSLKFYTEHLRQSATHPPQLLLLTDDRRNRELAEADGIKCSSTKDYVGGLVPEVRQSLVDLVVGGVDEMDTSERRGRRIYEEVSRSSLSISIKLILSPSICRWTCSIPVSRAADCIKDISTPASTITWKAPSTCNRSTGRSYWSDEPR